MKRRYRWLAVVVAFVIAVGIAVAVSAALTQPGDAARLQGAWVGVDRRMTFDGEIITDSRSPIVQTSRYYYRLPPAASPSRIVLFSADRPGVNHPITLLGFPLTQRSAAMPDWESRCIYELRGDRLRIGFPPAQPGADFPTSFDPAAGGLLLELHRE